MAKPEILPAASQAGMDHGKALATLDPGNSPPDFAHAPIVADPDDPFGGLPTVPVEASDHFPSDDDMMPGGKLSILQVIDDLFGA